MTGNVWKIELMGPLCARRGTQVVTRFRTQKTGALLACLANENRSYRREELIDLLWPEYDLESGRNCLRIALNALRQILEPGDDESGTVLIADRAQVQLNPVSYTTDKAEFESRINDALRLESDAERIPLLTEAVELYRSDLLPGYDEEWVTRERLRLQDVHLTSLRRLVKSLVKEKNLDTALEYARRAMNADPLREESHRTLIHLYKAIGRPGAALRQYKELERLLQEEFGTAPSTVTQELVAQVAAKTQAKTALVAERGGVATMNSAFPLPLPPSAPSLLSFSRPSHLPTSLTRFFGREDCMAHLLDLIDQPDVRLITLTGLGGSGKTRLAMAMAERACSEYNGAVWFVPLASLTDARQILDAILRAMNVPRTANSSPLDRVADAIGNRVTLLTLDNFEHLTEQGAIIIATLLERCPNLKCLITSRQRLNLIGEHEYAVLPLATPLSPGTPERLLEFASVQLFVDRAQAVRPGFQVTTTNAASIAALCHYLEGVPLAIELAAAYAQAMTPAQILARLSPRLPLLINRNRDVPSRHASLRAALDWSYNLLSSELQPFFARLSTFRGGWTLEAAEAVCQEPFALEFLIQLRERSLITAEETEYGMQFMLLETVREYAAEQLSPQEVEIARNAHLAYYLQLAEESEAARHQADAEERALQLTREQDNLRSALDWALRDGECEEETRAAGLRLAATLWRFWYRFGGYEEGYERLGAALRLNPNAPSALRVQALRGAGNLAYSLGRHTQARTLFEQCLALAQTMEDAPGMAAALGSLGNVANEQGDYCGAQSLFEKSLTLFRELADMRGISLTLANLANTACNQGDFVTARSLHRESLELFREADDRHNIAHGLNNLAHTLLQCGDYSEARPLLIESLTLSRDLGSRRSLVHGLSCCITLAIAENALSFAAMLLGAMDNLRENRQSLIAAKAIPEYERQKVSVRAALGERTFESAWSQGRAMSLEQVADTVLMEISELQYR